MSDRKFLVGTGSDRIYTCQLTADGNLSMKNETKTGRGPSWLIYRHGLIYATNEKDDQIEIFKLNDGKLISLKKCSSYGSTPCSLDIDPSGRYLAVANYGGLGPSNFVLYQLDKDHFPDEKNVQIDCQAGSHCHQVHFDEDELYGVDLGTDTISRFHYKNELKLSQPRISTESGAGPRHLLFDREKKFVYLVNELNSTANVFRVDSNFELIQNITTRSSTVENHPSELHLTNDGKFLVVSNRGENNLVVFSVNQGFLTLQKTLESRGSWPRFFTFDPTENFLLVANEKSNTLICFRFDSNENSFQYVSELNNLETPQHIVFYSLK